MGKKMILSVLLAALSLDCAAQFYVSGTDPGRVRWMQVETDAYRVLYPRGLDSLALRYAACLESVRRPVSRSCGYVPGEKCREKMPVVLHSFTAEGNGMVAWTPRRMDLYTIPDSYSPDPSPWMEQLVTHESRHYAQMQYVRDGVFRPLGWLCGEISGGAASALYCGPAFFEGDAVVAETGLGTTGRGRDASFLEYYRSCLRDGKYRDYWQWLYGSLNRYTPDHYALGYVTIAGLRTLWDRPDFTNLYYERLRRWRLPFFNFQNTILATTGLGLDDAFSDICTALDTDWKANDSARGPFIKARVDSEPEGRYVENGPSVFLDSLQFFIRRGMGEAAAVIRRDPDGKERKVGRFCPANNGISTNDEGTRIIWTEQKSDPRWEMASYSVFCTMDSSGTRRQVGRRTRLYGASMRGSTALSAEYDGNGKYYVVTFNADSGDVINRYSAPEGLLPLSPEFVGDGIWCIGITDGGSGIYDVCDSFREVMHPIRARVGNFMSNGGLLTFESDRSGVGELYCIDPESRKVKQLTRLEQGGRNFQIHGDSLYFNVQKPGGLVQASAALSDCLFEDVDNPGEGIFEPVFARRLSQQEKALEVADSVTDSLGCTISEPRAWRKAAHLFKVHSWAPFYVNFDSVSSLSLETISRNAGLGATVFFQNQLGSAYGMAGWHAAFKDGQWRHSGHAKFCYTGLWPVFELSFDYNDRNSCKRWIEENGEGKKVLYTTEREKAFIDAKARVYVPLNFSSGGWRRGVIPQLEYELCNDVFIDGTKKRMDMLTASVRAYAMSYTAPSRIWPEWGIGAEAGWMGRPLLMDVYLDNPYFYLYGYTPGVGALQGVKFTALAQRSNASFTLDYAIPFANLEWSGLCPLVYVRNLELTPHLDYNFFYDGSFKKFGYGFDLSARLGNLLWIPYPAHLGISVRNTGVGFLFSVDI